MKGAIKSFALNPLITGSFFLFSGGLLASFFNFIFTVLMSRNLSVSDYGALISLISIITLLSIPSGAITPTIVTIAGEYFAKEDRGHLHAFYLKLFKGLVIAGLLLLLLFIPFSRQIADFFKIENIFLLTLTILGVLLFYILSLNTSFMQAKLAFRFLSLFNSVSSLFKVLLAFALVLLGWGLLGALLGFLLSLLLAIFIGIYYFRGFIFFKSFDMPKISSKELISYGIPSAVIIFSLNALISTDLLLVKHLFSSHEAGLYAGLSLVGRVIFFLSAPIGVVMFPILVKRFNSGQNYKFILYLACLLVGSFSVIISTFYYFFPEFSVLFFLKNDEYLSVSQYLFRFSIFITLYSMVSLISYYFLSVKKTSFSYLMLFGALLQVIIIYMYHKSFSQVIDASIAVCFLILLASLYFFRKTT